MPLWLWLGEGRKGRRRSSGEKTTVDVSEDSLGHGKQKAGAIRCRRPFSFYTILEKFGFYICS